MAIENQFENTPLLNPDDFKTKSPEDMVDTILSNPDSTTEEIWNILLDKLSANGENPRRAFGKLYENIDTILNQSIPDRLILVLYGNATNIFVNSEELRKKISAKNPELINKTINHPWH